MLPRPLVLSLFLFAACLPLEPNYDVDQVAGPKNGTLVIVGGGANTAQLFQLMKAKAAAGPVVVIPTAQATGVPTAQTVEMLSAAFGAGNVTVLHTNDRATADTAAFAAPLTTAGAVWFDGGRQFRLADAYLNTATHRAILGVLDRGGVVGGTSAGATIQGQAMVRGARVDGTTVVGPNTTGNQVIVGGAQIGLALLPNTVIDQHVTQRGRQNDLFRFYFDNDNQPTAERIDRQAIANPLSYLGIAIDESTAAVVNGPTLEVWSAEAAQPGRQIRIFNPAAWPAGVTCTTSVECPVNTLDVGQRYQLGNRARL